MKNAIKILSAGSAIAMAMTASAFAADLAVPEYVEPPVFQAPEHVPASMSGWYIRGDVGYSWNKFSSARYNTYGAVIDAFGNAVAVPGRGVLNGELKKSFSIGAGLGYQVNHYLRADTTLDYDFKTDFNGSTVGTCFVAGGTAGAVEPCSSSDVSSYTALTLLANTYVDLGTYNGFTPYIGGGIGGARVKWTSLDNTECSVANPADCNPTVSHAGSAKWRFAYALMAGVSYDINKKVSLDLGYRYKKIHGAHMFDIAGTPGVGPGYDRGIQQHQIRAGLRYKFGGMSQASAPVYNPVYK